jgi:hypothetical protein
MHRPGVGGEGQGEEDGLEPRQRWSPTHMDIPVWKLSLAPYGLPKNIQPLPLPGPAEKAAPGRFSWCQVRLEVGRGDAHQLVLSSPMSRVKVLLTVSTHCSSVHPQTPAHPSWSTLTIPPRDTGVTGVVPAARPVCKSRLSFFQACDLGK